MAEGVKFCYLNAPVEITGTAAGKVNGLKVEIMELGEPDEKGRRKPVGTGKFKTIKVNSVIALSARPSTGASWMSARSRPPQRALQWQIP